jgi:hypothetical protein
VLEGHITAHFAVQSTRHLAATLEPQVSLTHPTFEPSASRHHKRCGSYQRTGFRNAYFFFLISVSNIRVSKDWFLNFRLGTSRSKFVCVTPLTRVFTQVSCVAFRWQSVSILASLPIYLVPALVSCLGVVLLCVSFRSYSAVKVRLFNEVSQFPAFCFLLPA